MPQSDSRKWNGTEATNQPSAADKVAVSTGPNEAAWVDKSTLSDVSAAVILAPNSSARNAITSSGNSVGLSVQAAPGQTAVNFQTRDSSGNVILNAGSSLTGVGLFANTNSSSALYGNANDSAAAPLTAIGVRGLAEKGYGGFFTAIGGGIGVAAQSSTGNSAWFKSSNAGNTEATVKVERNGASTADLLDINGVAGFDADGNLFAPNFSPGGGGTVTSVDLTAPAFLSVSGNPVTTSGTLALTLATQSANSVFAGPTSGGAATPTFRALVAADIPSVTNYSALWHLGTATWYASPDLAIAAAVSGDVVETFGGSFNIVNLLKNGVNLVFHGTEIAATSGGTAAVFDDGPNGANGAVTCSITGSGKFSVSITSRKLFNIQNGSSIYVECDTLATSASAGALLDQTGTSSVVRIRTNQLNPQSTATNAINCSGSSAYQEVDALSLNANNGGAITLASTGSNCYQVIRALYANNLRDISCSNGSQHVELGGLEGLSSCDIINTTGRQMIHVHGLRTNTGFNSITQGGAGGIQHIYAKELRLGGASGFGAGGSVECSTGTQYISADSITGTTSTADLVSCSGGTQTVDARLVTLAQASRFAVECTGGTQRLVNVRVVNTNSTGVAGNYAGGTMITEGTCTFVSGGSATDALTAPSAQNLKNYGVIVGNKAKHANITLQVNTVSSYFSDANVV